VRRGRHWRGDATCRAVGGAIERARPPQNWGASRWPRGRPGQLAGLILYAPWAGGYYLTTVLRAPASRVVEADGRPRGAAARRREG
jgi:hypothetical protein